MLKAETDDEVRGELSRALEKFDTALYGAQVGIYWNAKTTVPPSLKSQWSRDRIEAATALRDAAALRASQLAEIRTALKSEWSVGVTGILIQALEKHGSKDAASQAFLQACIDDPRLWLRREAIAAIATVDDSRLVKIIEQAYTARDSSSRTGTRSDFEATVAKLIERQNPARWQAMTAMAPSLEKDLNSPYQRRQALAIGYVRLIGPAAAPMIPKLQELVKARSPNGEEALSALTEMGTALAPKTVPIFISELGKGAFYEPEVLVRLQYLGPAAKAALPALQVRLRESGSEPVVGSAIQKTIKDIQAPAR
jgi:hypothetical protein